MIARRVWMTAALIGMLGLTLGLSKLSERRRPDHLARPLSHIPLHLAGWDFAAESPLTLRALSRLVPTDYISRIYTRNGVQLNLFIAYYDEQRGGESIHSPKQCLPGSGWEIWQYGSAVIPAKGAPMTVNRYSIRKETTGDVMLYWYQTRDRIIASEYLGKMLLLRDSLTDGSTAGSIVRLILPDKPQASADAISFASALIPEVQQCFRH